MIIMNSTCCLSKMILKTKSIISSVMKGSEMVVESCEIMSKRSRECIFLNEIGNVRLNNVRVLEEWSCPLVHCSSGLSSLIEVKRSEFSGIVSVGGSFLMRGRVEKEIVRECLFLNMSICGRESEECIAERYVVGGSEFVDDE